MITDPEVISAKLWLKYTQNHMLGTHFLRKNYIRKCYPIFMKFGSDYHYYVNFNLKECHVHGKKNSVNQRGLIQGDLFC